MSEWLEVGSDNYVLVTEGSLLNTGLIVGNPGDPRTYGLTVQAPF